MSTFKQDDLIAFGHAAAGHEGVLSNSAGSVVVKPCTPAEVSFYETALAQHPAFAECMPTFMGTLELADKAGVEDQIAAAGADPATVQGLEEIFSNTAATQESAETGPAVIAAAPLPEGEISKVPLAESGGNLPPASVDKSIPQQNGTEDAGIHHTQAYGKHLATTSCIVLSNAAVGFTRPNVLDLKLGSKLWDDKASQEKRARLDKVAAESTSSSLGFRIAGMKVSQTKAGSPDEQNANEEGDGYKVYGKMYGRKFRGEDVKDGFKEYFICENAGLDAAMMKILARRIKADITKIRKMLEAEESRMVGASILVVVEGDGDVLRKTLAEENQAAASRGANATNAEDEDEYDEDEDEEEKPRAHNVVLIDFAHAEWTPGHGPDENVLEGVRNIERILVELEGGTDVVEEMKS
ncbi:MAG: hypothetical protein M4579_004938 [Chaenotheca gracillima]|nr:MAG: hypothetical protein M4579_004938 [Chaenotheca gracillima]